MQLIGMLNSPYVRRVAVALIAAEVPFEHRPISLFRHIDAFSAINPLLKAPTLVADDGTVLIDSTLILDYLAGLYPAVAALTPAAPGDRARALRLTGLALVGDGEGGPATLRARLTSRGQAPSAVGRPRHGPAPRGARGARSRSCRKPAGSPAAWASPTSRPPAPTASPRGWSATWSMSAPIATSPPSRRAPRRFPLSAPRRPRTASSRRLRSEPAAPRRGALRRKKSSWRRYTARPCRAEEYR